MNKREDIIMRLATQARGELAMRKPAVHLRRCFDLIADLHGRDDTSWADIAELFNSARRKAAAATADVSPQTLCRLFHLEKKGRDRYRRTPDSLGVARTSPDRERLTERPAPETRSDSLTNKPRDGPRGPEPSVPETDADEIRKLLNQDRTIKKLKDRKNE